nr:MAG TPA: Tor inhibition protein helix, reverse turn, PROTEIN [Caudoviricetes sp.]
MVRIMKKNPTDEIREIDMDDVLTSAELVKEFPKFFTSQPSVVNYARNYGLPHWGLKPRTYRFSRKEVTEWLWAQYHSGSSPFKAESKLKIVK